VAPDDVDVGEDEVDVDAEVLVEPPPVPVSESSPHAASEAAAHRAMVKKPIEEVEVLIPRSYAS